MPFIPQMRRGEILPIHFMLLMRCEQFLLTEDLFNLLFSVKSCSLPLCVTQSQSSKIQLKTIKYHDQHCRFDAFCHRHRLSLRCCQHAEHGASVRQVAESGRWSHHDHQPVVPACVRLKASLFLYFWLPVPTVLRLQLSRPSSLRY